VIPVLGLAVIRRVGFKDVAASSRHSFIRSSHNLQIQPNKKNNEQRTTKQQQRTTPLQLNRMTNNVFSRLSTAALVVAATTATTTLSVRAEDVPFIRHSSYKPDEEISYFDMIMKPYPIPVKGTTYTNFYFNIPEDTPDYFHAVFGETINSQPKHLHHFVLYGCAERIDPSLEGLPYEDDVTSFSTFSNQAQLPVVCETVLGSWTPGATTMGISDTETGILMGRAMGHQALRLNIHYTDGVYRDPEEKIHTMATDGMRVYYTKDFRPYTTQFVMLQQITSDEHLTVPPNESRFFVTKTCKVDSGCKDVSEDYISLVSQMWTPEFFQTRNYSAEIENAMIGATDCSSLEPLCGTIDEYPEMKALIRYCPSTCGICGEGSIYNPDNYRVDQVWYHAHLLGSEMYSTHIREDDESGKLVAKDIASQDFWNFDFQHHFPAEDTMVQNNKVVQGMEVKPGDKIQTTCVYNSLYQDEPTAFGFSTYEEMCDVYYYLKFETPEHFVSGFEHPLLAPIDQLQLMTFNCVEDEETNVYTGILADDEDGRDLWENHPIEEAEGCKYNTIWIGLATLISGGPHSCPENEKTSPPATLNGDEEEAVLSAASNRLGWTWGFALLSAAVPVIATLAY